VPAPRVRLVRGGVTYATGMPVRRSGRLVLRFRPVRRIVRGAYVLIVNERAASGGRTITRLAIRL
jgi:hypothetical protein